VFLEKGIEGRQGVAHRGMVAQRVRAPSRRYVLSDTRQAVDGPVWEDRLGRGRGLFHWEQPRRGSAWYDPGACTPPLGAPSRGLPWKITRETNPNRIRPAPPAQSRSSPESDATDAARRASMPRASGRRPPSM
jgi:hypothetical protein